MLRKFHSLPGLVAGLFVILLSISGALLSVFPTLERIEARPAPATMTVADIASTVAAAYPGVERIDRKANGLIVVGYSTPDTMGSVVIDPATGAEVRVDEGSPVMGWLKNLHRSFLMEDQGRVVAGIAAGFMSILAVTGVLMLIARMGGWRRLARPVAGSGAGRVHAVAGRIGVTVLAVSAVTGVYMSLANFGFIDDGSANSPDFPFSVAGTAPAEVGTLAALQSVPLSDLRRLTFPFQGDPTDVFGLQTNAGSGYVDQATGQMLTWLPHSTAQTIWETVYMLHTGQGLWWFGLVMGIGILSVPVLSVTGTLVWLTRRRATPRIASNMRPGAAETVILVGSEGGTTWGFAASLHRALTAAGHKVHTAPMNAVTTYPKAARLFILAATYGDGSAPASATRFLDRIAALPVPSYAVTVLGFGDRMYPDFCGYATTVSTALATKGWTTFHPMTLIDRQNGPDFADWGRKLGTTLGLNLPLDHSVRLPALRTLTLLSRQDFGEEVQAPAAILRFGPGAPDGLWQRLTGARLPRFHAGDLVNILAPDSDLPRSYSLASSRGDGFLEICVRKSPGGLCSTFLHGLRPGDTIRATVKPNPGFRPQPGRNPVVLVAAGCGIGPMAGFLRHNRPGRPMELYFGTRDPRSDYLYEHDLTRWQNDRRLSRLTTAFSRVNGQHYVQDKIRADGDHLRHQIGQGGQIMVCGGIAMARAVATEIDRALAPIGLNVATLRAEGRYLEDVY